MSHNIFVYGTLLSGEANAHVMAGAKLLGIGTVPGTLYGFGFAPGAVHPKRKEHVPGSVVHGELYEVNDALLDYLDVIECEPINYTRTRVGVRLTPTKEQNGSVKADVVLAEVYYYNWPVDGGELIASGCWADRKYRVP